MDKRRNFCELNNVSSLEVDYAVNIFSEILSDNQKTNSGKDNSHTNISDELLKLNELKDKGILTQEEFDAQKKKLLSQ